MWWRNGGKIQNQIDKIHYNGNFRGLQEFSNSWNPEMNIEWNSSLAHPPTDSTNHAYTYYSFSSLIQSLQLITHAKGMSSCLTKHLKFNRKMWSWVHILANNVKFYFRMHGWVNKTFGAVAGMKFSKQLDISPSIKDPQSLFPCKCQEYVYYC